MRHLIIFLFVSAPAANTVATLLPLVKTKEGTNQTALQELKKENLMLKEKLQKEKSEADTRESEKGKQITALQAQIQRELRHHQLDMDALTKEMNDKLRAGKEIEMQEQNKLIIKAKDHADELREVTELHKELMKEKHKEQQDLMLEMTKHFQNEIRTAHHQWQRDLANTWEVDRNDVDTSDVTLGAGRLGRTFKGNFRGTEVAVKKIHQPLLTEQNYKLVCWQINFLAQIRHPNLLLFLGAVILDCKYEDRNENSLIVTELADLSLRSAYQKDLVCECSRTSILGDVASALLYLHTNRVPTIHGSLSSSKILLTPIGGNHKWKAKLSVFGLANILPNAAASSKANETYYTAPEVISGYSRDQTDKVDVYGFGVLICEVVLRRFPPENREEFPVMLSEVSAKDHTLFQLAMNCTKRSHLDRPPMIEITKTLRTQC